ncbi:alpha/beta fold hydrolase [Sporolactobacillus sp. THM7-7]|nr:alpha/beta fold hydrolase [Sporolactobacillus sp. THM7-7]
MPMPVQKTKMREKTNRKWDKKKKIFFSSVILSSAAAFCKVAGDAIGNYFYKLAIARNDKTELTNALNADVEKITIPPFVKDAMEKQREASDAFIRNHPPEEIYRHSHDGLKLHAYRFMTHPDSHRWAVLLHGYMEQGTDMFFFACAFARHGFNVLVPDLRGAGKSEGGYIGMGWDDRLDVVGWIHEIVENDPEAKIAVHGVSMGGATAMMTAGEDLPENVIAIVEDCGYSSVEDEFAHELRNLYSLPAFPVMQLADRTTRSRAGYSIYEASSVEQLKKAKVPMLFIHGGADNYVPTEMVYKVYEAAPVEKELLVVDQAPHAASSVVNPDLYFTKLFRFIEKYLDKPQRLQVSAEKVE